MLSPRSYSLRSKAGWVLGKRLELKKRPPTGYSSHGPGSTSCVLRDKPYSTVTAKP